MKLKQFSLWFSLIVLFAITANAVFLFMIQKAHNSVVTVQEHRQRAMSLANELRQETEQLASLVRAYTSTGQTNYLMYYYDIIYSKRLLNEFFVNLFPGFVDMMHKRRPRG